MGPVRGFNGCAAVLAELLERGLVPKPVEELSPG
jgi:hypothetical protein